MKIEGFLRRVCAALELNGVPYMITGSVASSIHGVPRSTNDLDVVIAPSREQLVSLVQTFQRVGYYARWEDAESALRRRGQFNVVDLANAWKVDLIVRKKREFSESEFSRREAIEVGDLAFTIATPEDVLIAKLEWMKISPSERQLQDAVGIVTVQGKGLDRSYVEKWVATLDLTEQWASVCNAAGWK